MNDTSKPLFSRRADRIPVEMPKRMASSSAAVTIWMVDTIAIGRTSVTGAPWRVVPRSQAFAKGMRHLAAPPVHRPAKRRRDVQVGELVLRSAAACSGLLEERRSSGGSVDRATRLNITKDAARRMRIDTPTLRRMKPTKVTHFDVRRAGGIGLRSPRPSVDRQGPGWRLRDLP